MEFDVERIGENKITAPIIKLVLNDFKPISIQQVESKDREQSIVEARHVCMYVLHNRTQLKAEAIGRAFNRERTTVLHAVEKVEDYMGSYPKFNKKVKSILKKIRKWQNQKEKLNT